MLFQVTDENFIGDEEVVKEKFKDLSFFLSVSLVDIDISTVLGRLGKFDVYLFNQFLVNAVFKFGLSQLLLVAGIFFYPPKQLVPGYFGVDIKICCGR